MQKVNSLCIDSRALRAEYCIVGISHNIVMCFNCIELWKRYSASVINRPKSSYIRCRTTFCLSKIMQCNCCVIWTWLTKFCYCIL